MVASLTSLPIEVLTCSKCSILPHLDPDYLAKLAQICITIIRDAIYDFLLGNKTLVMNLVTHLCYIMQRFRIDQFRDRNKGAFMFLTRNATAPRYHD